MKPLIIARDEEKLCFEEERIRKHLKNSLEVVNFGYTTNIYDHYDIIHFVNYSDFSEITDAKKSGKPLIASMFYSELNYKSAYARYKKEITLKKRYLRIYPYFDLILVPNIRYKNLLEFYFPNIKAEVFNYPVNLNRYNLSNIEKKLMYRYYTERDDAKIIICIGNYSVKEDIDHVSEIASISKKYKFYFLGENFTQFTRDLYADDVPENVMLINIPEDDVFRSLMYNCKAVINLNPLRIDNMITSEAMIAKKPIICVKNKNYPNILVDYIHLASGPYEIICMIENLVEKKIDDKTDKAYDYISEFSFEKSGNKLIKIYNEILKRRDL